MNAEKDLQKMDGDFDSLTGLYNIEAFYKVVALILEARPDVEYNIVYMDINCFNIINDLFQIETGDLILKAAL